MRLRNRALTQRTHDARHSKAVPELVTVVTVLRPPVVVPAGGTGRCRVVGNTEVVNRPRHVHFFGDDEHKAIPCWLSRRTWPTAKPFDATSRYLVPLTFDELTDRAKFRAKRELKAVGTASAVGTVTANQRLKPIFHA
ncbi:MAG TPA: hypothetical protein VF292_00550 [Rhodanobacteraceae bacterium]